MKKILAGLMAASVIAGVAHAATFSKNAVGFINVEIAAEELVALTIPFVNMESDDGNWTFKDTQLANDAPTASTVYFWDGTSWAPYSKGRQGFATDYVLKPGEAFFFQPSEDMTVTISGEVPDETTIGVPVTGAANLSAIGNPYPVSVKFTDTTLASQAATASTVYFWDGTSWAPYSKGRQGFATDYEVAPGEGFFFQTSDEEESTEWAVEKPYVYP